MIDSIHHPETRVSARDAAKRVGYSPDYVTRLARSGKIDAERRGRTWYVDPDSLKLFSLVSEQEKRERNEALRRERLRERVQREGENNREYVVFSSKVGRSRALLETLAVTVCVALFILLTHIAVIEHISPQDMSHAIMDELHTASAAFSFDIPSVSRQTASFAFVYPGPKRTIEAQPTFRQTDKGMLVFDFPDIGKATLEILHGFFSDEIIIEVDTATATEGFIRPIFRERTGDAYPFIFE